MKLIVGLGNPGREYAGTRHNAGFMVVEALASRHRFPEARSNFQGLVADAAILGERSLLLRPMTYMNRSGQSLREAMDFYKLTPEQLLVIVDDTALPCGKIRLRKDGSAGGHNGLKDVERVLGSNVYPRLRVGIDPPGPGRIPQHDYVLARFTDAQKPLLEESILRACEAIERWITAGIDEAMNRYNG